MKKSRAVKKTPKLKGEKLNIQQISDLSGSTFRTCKKRIKEAGISVICEDGKSLFYDSAVVLPAIFNINNSGKSNEDHELFDPVQEKARKDAMQADNYQIDRDRKLEKILLKDDCDKIWINIVIAIKSKIRAFPYKIINRISSISDKNLQLEEMKKASGDLLDDLSQNLNPDEIEKLEDFLFSGKKIYDS